MTKNKQFKYIIPLALVATMVLAVMPAYATQVTLYSSSSEVQTNHNAAWISNPSEPTYDLSAGDTLIWYNWWGHYDDNYQSVYQAYAKDKFSGMSSSELSVDADNPGQVLSFNLAYHQSNAGNTKPQTGVTGSQTSFSRYHDYYYTPDVYTYETSAHTVSLS